MISNQRFQSTPGNESRTELLGSIPDLLPERPRVCFFVCSGFCLILVKVSLPGSQINLGVRDYVCLVVDLPAQPDEKEDRGADVVRNEGLMVEDRRKAVEAFVVVEK